MFREATLDEDQKKHTDLVYDSPSGNVGFRIQRREYYMRYGAHFTIREATQSGKETEYKRIMHGLGPGFMLAAFEHEDSQDRGWIGLWWLINMKKFRYAPERGILRRNKDGSTFRRIQLDQYPADIISNHGHSLVKVK